MSQTSQTLADGLAVLRCVHAARAPISKNEIAETLRLERTKVHRLVNTLHAGGFVGRLPTGEYVLTPLLGSMATDHHQRLRQAAGGPLTHLAERTGMTAHVSICDGDVVTALRVVAPSNAVFHVGYREGSTHPVDRGAAGIVLLARRSNGTDARPDLAEVRKAGYAATFGELQAGAVGVAMAVDLDALDVSIGVVTMGAGGPIPGALIAAITDARHELETSLESGRGAD